MRDALVNDLTANVLACERIAIECRAYPVGDASPFTNQTGARSIGGNENGTYRKEKAPTGVIVLEIMSQAPGFRFDPGGRGRNGVGERPLTGHVVQVNLRESDGSISQRKHVGQTVRQDAEAIQVRQTVSETGFGAGGVEPRLEVVGDHGRQKNVVVQQWIRCKALSDRRLG